VNAHNLPVVSSARVWSSGLTVCSHPPARGMMSPQEQQNMAMMQKMAAVEAEVVCSAFSLPHA
jgi:hypothetical protein